MSIHTLIPLAAATGLAGLLYAADVRGGGLPATAPVRGVMWLAARWRWQHGVHAAWVAGADLLRALAEPAEPLPPWHNVPPRDDTNSCRWGRARCRECRLGGDCGHDDTDERPAYAAGMSLTGRLARHSDKAAVVRWLAAPWGGLAAMPVRLRRDLGRLAGMTRTPTADLGELAEDTASVRQWLAARRETSAQLVLGTTGARLP